MINQWETLSSQLEVTNFGIEICDTTDLSRFELETRIALPIDYKEYSQIFGTGLFGYGMHIYAPTPYLIEYSEGTIELFKENLTRFPSDDVERDGKLKKLFDSSFVFADDSGAHVAVWDLRTYGEDKNYDIYWIDIDLIDDAHKIGRNFFDFVWGFSLGNQPYNFLPETKRPPLDQPQTFRSFPTSTL